MFHLTRLFLFIAFCILSSSAFSQFRLKGRVIHAETGQPLPSISVYLNNTSMGTSTNESGEFSIGSIPPGKYKLVVSGVGFETYSRLINTREPMEDLKVSLKPAVEQLKRLEVTPPDADGWKKWGGLFTQIFIGTTPLSSDCHILNPEVLKFRMNSDNTLTVYAEAPIHLYNNALGYDVRYKMEDFEYDLSTKIVEYDGYALFTDLCPAHPKKAAGWQQKRRETYSGSVLHFMRAFFVNKLESEGFEMRSLGKVFNAEKLRAKMIFSKSRLALDTNKIEVVAAIWPTLGAATEPLFNRSVNSTDSTDYFKKALLQPDSVISHQLVPADSVGFAADSVTAGFYFPDSLEVSYKLKDIPAGYRNLSRKHRHETFPVSQFVFISGKPIYVLSNGFYYGPHGLKITGYWAWAETMATLLPYDYVLRP